MWEALAQIASIPEGVLFGAVLVFVRIGAVASLLPGLSAQSLPYRVRLTVSVAFTALVYPLIFPQLPTLPNTFMAVLPLMFAEAAIGLAFGLSIRIMVMALQFAGSIAAQSTAIAQIMGASATPDPLPAFGNILVFGGIALALAADLHLKALGAMVATYDVIPMGGFPEGSAVAEWGVSHAARAFGLAFTLAAPFVIASIAYNLSLGVINRAMPQLMVAFIFSPAITAVGILILALASPVILMAWNGHLDSVLAVPFGSPP